MQMYIINSRESSEIFLKRSIIDVLRGKKWNCIKWQLKAGSQKKKRWQKKKKNPKTKGNKYDIFTNMVDINPAMSIITLFLIFKLYIYIYIYILSRLHAQCGAWNHDLEIKSHVLYQLSQPGTPINTHFKMWTV